MPKTTFQTSVKRIRVVMAENNSLIIFVPEKKTNDYLVRIFMIEFYVPSVERASTSSPKRRIKEPIVRFSNSGLSIPPPNKRNNSTGFINEI